MQDWMWLIIVVAVILLVWWLISLSTRREDSSIEPSHEEHTAPTRETQAAIPSTRDDFSKLEGIGPKISGLLHQEGIHTFAQLAETDTSRLRALLDVAGQRFTDTSTWAEQASLAAEAKWEELEKLQARLKGGRRVK